MCSYVVIIHFCYLLQLVVIIRKYHHDNVPNITSRSSGCETGTLVYIAIVNQSVNVYNSLCKKKEYTGWFW
jgi:hypothetical protein